MQMQAGNLACLVLVGEDFRNKETGAEMWVSTWVMSAAAENTHSAEALICRPAPLGGRSLPSNYHLPASVCDGELLFWKVLCGSQQGIRSWIMMTLGFGTNGGHTSAQGGGFGEEAHSPPRR